MRRRLFAPFLAALLVALSLSAVAPANAAPGDPGSIDGFALRDGSADSSGLTVSRYIWNGDHFVFQDATSTAADGHFNFAFVAVGTSTIEVQDGPGSLWSTRWYGGKPYVQQDVTTGFTVSTGAVSHVNVTLIQGGTFTVHVVAGPSKTPVGGAHVTLYFLDLGNYNDLTDYDTVPTDGFGNFTVVGAPYGDYALKVSLAGFTTEYFNDWSEADFSRADHYTAISGGTTPTADVWLNTGAPLSRAFQDVPSSSTFFTAIDWMYTTKISTGTPVDYERPLYKPVDSVSRQAMAQFLYREKQSATPGYNFSPPADPTFADVPSSSPFFTAIEWMAASGISTGTAQPTGKPFYKPLDAVSRQAMALFLYRDAGASFSPPVDPTFADVPSDATQYTAIEWMASAGISTGTSQPSGKPLYKPFDPVSRQAMALFLYRFAH